MFESAHDLNIKYEGCTALYKGALVHVSSFEGESEIISTFYPIHPLSGCPMTGNRKKIPYNESDFEFIIPNLGYINLPKTAVHIIRKHKRASPQRYRKGFMLCNCKITFISKKELDYTGEIKFFDNFAEIIIPYLFFNNLFLSYQKAIDSILNGERLSSAITSSIAIVLDGTLDKIFLHKNRWPIGTFNFKTKQFDMVINDYNEELFDLDINFKEAA